ncbi:MAG: GNAT family N-acetyltransferase [Candidatus Sabulitectum sp.]|nr:GNAT family N-acetyltransferase [Candidatus Sabulitectum sp.]
MVELRRMNETEFTIFKDLTVKSFAAGNISAGNWSEEEAEARAGGMLGQLLPEGATTAGHRFYTITGQQGDIGAVWIFVNGDTAFLFDIMLDEEFRGMGYGCQTMYLLEKKLVEEGIREIELHVFGHNTPARALYLKTGYRETDVTMKKRITEREQ